jgi:hypothetical protein
MINITKKRAFTVKENKTAVIMKVVIIEDENTTMIYENLQDVKPNYTIVKKYSHLSEALAFFNFNQKLI